MRSLAERANLLATPSGFWQRELLGAKPIAVCPLRDPSRTRPEILDEWRLLGSCAPDQTLNYAVPKSACGKFHQIGNGKRDCVNWWGNFRMVAILK
jgi:hypothetical protein